MDRNTEWWWRELYDEDGEIGLQKEWEGESWFKLLVSRMKTKYHFN